MTFTQYKKLQFLSDAMVSYGVDERGHKIAQHAFRHLHYEILGRIGFYCDICVAGRKEIEEMMNQKGRSHNAILTHQKI